MSRLSPRRFSRHVPRSLASLALALAALAAGGAVQAQSREAEPGRMPPNTTAPAAGPGDVAWLEGLRFHTWRGAHWLARSINGWFGDKPFEPQGRVSGYVRVGTLWEQHAGTKFNLRFRLSADLPNLESRAYAFVGQENKQELVTDQPDLFTREQLLLREARREDQSFFAGLGWRARSNVDFRLGFRGGLKPYAQVRYQSRWQLSERDSLHFRESLFWSSRHSLGSTTVLEYERQLRPALLLRWSNVGTITRRGGSFDWQSSLGLIRALPGLRTLTAEALVQGRPSEVAISNYGLRTTWEQPIYKDWLLGKLTLGHFWPKDKDHLARKRSWAVGLSAEMRF